MSGRSEFSAARIEKCYDCLSESQLLCIKRFIVWYHGDEDWYDKDVDFALERLHSDSHQNTKARNKPCTEAPAGA